MASDVSVTQYQPQHSDTYDPAETAAKPSIESGDFTAQMIAYLEAREASIPVAEKARENLASLLQGLGRTIMDHAINANFTTSNSAQNNKCGTGR